MDEEQFGTTADYLCAFDTICSEGIAAHHDRLLRAHLAAPGCATTWAQLAEAVGYSNGSTVHLHYGKFAERVARHLGLTDKPLDPCGEGWWLWALVRWADDRDPDTGHTVFVLRRPVVEALQQLGMRPAEDDAANELTTESHDVPTPAGGVRYTAYFSDDAGRPCPKRTATQVEFVEYDAAGQEIMRTSGSLGSSGRQSRSW